MKTVERLQAVASNYIEGSYPIVTLEGPDGVGKSSVVEALEACAGEFFTAPCVSTREPGSPHVRTCTDIRRVFTSNEMSNLTASLLMLADRSAHLEWVADQLQTSVVIRDRGEVSTYVYQVYTRDAQDVQHYDLMDLIDTGMSKMPVLDTLSVTVVLDADDDVLDERLSDRGRLNRFDDAVLQKQVRGIYRQAWEDYSRRGYAAKGVYDEYGEMLRVDVTNTSPLDAARFIWRKVCEEAKLLETLKPFRETIRTRYK